MDILTLGFECRIDQVFTFETKPVTVLEGNTVNIMFSAPDFFHYVEIVGSIPFSSEICTFFLYLS